MKDVFDFDELDLENRLTRNALARRASRTINDAILSRTLLTKKQISELKRKGNPGMIYAKLLKESLKEGMTKRYLSLLSTEEAYAVIEAATRGVAANPNTSYEIEIPRVITAGDYRSFMKKHHSVSAFGRAARMRVRHSADDIQEVRRKVIDAGIDALFTYGQMDSKRT